MNSTFSLKKLLPHVLAVVFFFALTATYFSPVLLENKTLSQNDILQFKGGAKEAQDYRQKTGEEALWTNSMFSGMPTYLISTTYSGDLFRYVHKIVTLNLPALVANIFLALVCAYILFVALGMSTWLAIAGAIAITFGSYNILLLEAGHNSKSIAIAYVPLVLAGIIITFRRVNRNLWLGLALFTFGLTMQIRANHIQITYYLALMILIFGVVELVYAIKENWLADFFKRVLLLGIGALLALGVSFGRLYTTYEYGNYSIRGKSELTPVTADAHKSEGLDRDYAFSWSQGIGETITLLIPDFYGGASTKALSDKSETYKTLLQIGAPQDQALQIIQSLPVYWGDQPFTGGPVYVGAIVCFLFVLGLFLVEKRIRYWLLAATVLSIMLAWGKNFEAFNYFMFDYFPAYNKFRAVSMALVIALIAMPLLGILALYEFFYRKNAPDLTKKLLYAAGITAGFCVLAMVVGSMGDFSAPADQQLIKAQYPQEAINALREDRASMMQADGIRSIFFILLAAGILYFYLKNKLSAVSTSLLVGLLILIDLWTVDKRYLHNGKFERQVVEAHFEPSPADMQIMQDKDLSYRVLNIPNPFNDARTSYFHKSVGGYHGAKMRRYQDVIEQHIAQNNMDVLNMLNTRYFITGQPQQPVQRNPEALGNAWFVQTVRQVNSPDAEIAALKEFDPANEAIVDVSKFPVSARSFSKEGATIKLTKYEPNTLTYQAATAAPALAVFSEVYYEKGWKAFIDGKEVPHLRVNYILRALQVPAGKHTIEFRFEPASYKMGNMVSLISSILLLVGLVGVASYTIRRKQEPSVNV